MFRTTITILGLLVSSAQPIARPPVSPITGDPGLSLPRYQIIEPISDAAVKNITPINHLEMMGYHFDPMGSHPNAYTPANCTWGAASMEPAIPQSWGNANTWDDYARAAGITVSSTPIVGAVAQTDKGEFGHVAIVTAVNGDGTIEITEMNYDYHGGVRSRPALVAEFTYIYI